MILRLLIALLLIPSLSLAGQGMGPGPGVGRTFSATPTLVLDDALYEGSSTALGSHTVNPGPGGTWTVLSTTGTNVSTDGAVAATSASSLSANNVTDFSNGYTIVNGKTGHALYSFAACIRLDTTNKNGYCAFVSGDGTFVIQRMTNLAGTVISESAVCGTHSISTFYDVTITATGSTIEATYDGCTRTATDSTYSSGKPGMRLYSTSPRIVDIKAYESD